jgi:hypothetical protein
MLADERGIIGVLLSVRYESMALVWYRRVGGAKEWLFPLRLVLGVARRMLVCA